MTPTIRRALPVYLLVAFGALLAQSLWLLHDNSIEQTRVNLILQCVGLIACVYWSRRTAGTYLGVPPVILGAVFLWHSPFLIGYYFDLAQLREKGAFVLSIGEAQIPRATALVGLCISLTWVGNVMGFLHVRKLFLHATPNTIETNIGWSKAPSRLRHVTWAAFVAYIAIMLVYFLSEGVDAYTKEYIDLYLDKPTSEIARLYQSTHAYSAALIVCAIGLLRSRLELVVLLAVVAGIGMLQIMLGARSVPFMNVVALVVAVDYFIRRISWPWLVAIAIALMALSVVVGNARLEGLGTKVFDVGATQTGTRSLSIWEAIWETGGTIRVVIRTMEFIREDGFALGATFLYGVIYIVPRFIVDFVVGARPEIASPSLWLIEKSGDVAPGAGLGYSLVAEVYYNFGMAGALLFLPVGWLTSMKYFKFVYLHDRLAVMQALSVSALLSLFMRSESGSYLRIVVYAYLFVSLLRHLAARKDDAKLAR